MIAYSIYCLSYLNRSVKIIIREIWDKSAMVHRSKREKNI